jgi:type VI secretion system protein ImpK
MMAEATPFLALIASVRAGRAAIDLPGLHGKVVEAISQFERRLAGRYSDEEIRRAKYALATTADDVALNLPNQQADAAEWARRAIVVRFFGENIGGDRFWKLLDEMIASPAQYRDLLELYHACLAAGFEGRYRVMADGKREHLGQMQRVYVALEHPRSLSMTELSPQWKGQPTAAAKVGLWGPVALAAAAAAVVLTVIYIVLRIILAQTGGPASTALAHLNPDQPLRLSRVAPAPPAPPQDDQLVRLRQFLAPEIAQGLVVVIDDPSTVRVRTTVGQLFKSGSDALEPDRAGLFRRIGQAINTEPGPVRVEGYSDSDRVSSISFPDNMALSKARAETVANIVKGVLADSSRVTTEGYGEAQPIASNATAAGKAQNRRVEIVIQRKG